MKLRDIVNKGIVSNTKEKALRGTNIETVEKKLMSNPKFVEMEKILNKQLQDCKAKTDKASDIYYNFWVNSAKGVK